MKKKTASNSVPVVVRLPRKIVSALDKEAERNSRTRSGEFRVRIVESLRAVVRV